MQFSLLCHQLVSSESVEEEQQNNNNQLISNRSEISGRHRRGLVTRKRFNNWQLQQLFNTKWRINRNTNDDDLARLEEEKKKVTIRSNGLIQSSMQEDDDGDLNWRQGSSEAMMRQFVYYGCTCSSSSISYSSDVKIGGQESVTCSPIPCGVPNAPGITSYIVIKSTYTCSTSSFCSTIFSSSLFSTCGETCTPTTQLTAAYFTSYSYVAILTFVVDISPTTFTLGTIASTSTSVNVNSANCQSVSSAICSSTGSLSAFSPSSLVITRCPWSLRLVPSPWHWAQGPRSRMHEIDN